MTNLAETPIFGLVIPTFNTERHLDRLLTSIHSQSLASYSIAVVDQGSSDRTVEIARSYGCIVIDVPRSPFYTPPARSRNLGARAVEGEILLHLDADMQLGSSNFLAKLAGIIDRDHRAAIIHERDVASGFWANCKALERSCYRGTGMEAARAVSRDLFNQVGGYDADVSSGEDFYVTGLYRRETRLASDNEVWVWHHTGNYTLASSLRKKFSYGRTAAIYIHRAGAVSAPSATAIARESMAAYIRNWRLILKHPANYIGIFPMRALESIAVLLGMLRGPRDSSSSI